MYPHLKLGLFTLGIKGIALKMLYIIDFIYETIHRKKLNYQDISTHIHLKTTVV